MKVKELMAVDVEVLDPGATVEEAAYLMSDADVGALPVVEDEKVVGMLTDRDIVVRAVAEGLDPADTKVEDIMTPEVIHCYEDSEVEEAERLMAENQVRRVVVLTREGELAGVVALADLAAETDDAGDVLEEVTRPGGNPPLRAAYEGEPGTGVGARADAAAEAAPVRSLVRGELAAAETYRQALAKVEAGDPGSADLRRIESEHEEAARLLQKKLEDRGAEAPRSSGLWGAWSKAVEGTARLLGNKAAIRALKEGEEHGIHDYEDALKDESLDPDIKELISTELLPKTRAHVPVLDRFLSR